MQSGLVAMAGRGTAELVLGGMAMKHKRSGKTARGVGVALLVGLSVTITALSGVEGWLDTP